MEENLSVKWEKIIELGPGRRLFFGVHPEFGPVAVKQEPEVEELAMAWEWLRCQDGAYSVRSFEYDPERHWLVTEWIRPGTTLRREPDPQKRAEKFCRVFRGIHHAKETGESYLDWLDGIVKSCVALPEAKQIQSLARWARDCCQSVFSEYPDRVALHGDLHHDNLLLDPEGHYRAVDPKGVVGPEILDTARFLLNELNTPQGAAGAEHIRRMCAHLAHRLGYPQKTLEQLFCMEAVLANVWRVEDGLAVEQRELDIARALMDQPRSQSRSI